MKGVPRFMPRRLQDLVVFAAPAVFVVLWATGFIGAKFGLPYAEPLTFLTLRMGTVVVLLGAILSLTRPKWPGARGVAHSAVTGLLVHGLGLGGVFVAIGNGLSAGMVALVLSLQPALTSTIASRGLGERVRLLQWAGLALGLFGIYLIVARQGDHRQRHAVRMGGERGWASRHHGRHALSKALRWRDRLAPGALRAICGGGTFVCVRGGRLRNPHRELDAAISVRAWLARFGLVARRGLAALLFDPPCRGDAGRKHVLSDAAGDGADGLGAV